MFGSVECGHLGLKIVRRLPIALVVDGNGASSLASRSGSIPTGARDGNQGESNDVLPPMASQDLPPARQQPRVLDDSNNYTKEKFMKNGAKEFVGGVALIKAENGINNMETTFRAMQVPHSYKTRLATCIL